ncbi:MAG: hypothetical protein R3211_05065 [Balneolaceae bacterium]|nr:hypothetical protein [Balneolaceae bacterium]
MKTKPIWYCLVLVFLAYSFNGCDNAASVEDESLTASFVKAYAPNGFTAGQINQTIEVTAEFNHPVIGLEVKEVVRTVVDGFTAEYTIIAERTLNDETFDTVTVDYDIIEAGTHTLNFYYQLEGGTRQFLGSFQFAIDN